MAESFAFMSLRHSRIQARIAKTQNGAIDENE
jgi:hypothetical protein